MKNKLLSPVLKSFLVLTSLCNISTVFGEDNIIYRHHPISDFKVPFGDTEVTGVAHAPVHYDSKFKYVYVVDTNNNQIQQFLDQTFIRQWGTKGSNEGQFMTPTGIDTATDGSVYIADSANNRIQQFTYNGIFIRQWGSHGSEAGYLNNPTAITVATDGSVYVVDSGNNRIQQFSSEGNYIRQFGSNGSEAGQFNFPTDIDIASDGNIFVVDHGNNRVQKFNTEGTFIRQVDNFDSETGIPYSIAMLNHTDFKVVNRNNDRPQLFTAHLSYETTSTFNDARSIDMHDDADVYTYDPNAFYTQTHKFDYDSNENWLVFKAFDGQYGIHISNVGADINPALALYDGSGNLIIRSDTGLTGENENIHPRYLPETGHYYIKITNSETEFNNNTHYDISVSYDSLHFYNDPPEDIFLTGLVFDKCNNDEIDFANIDYGYGITDSDTRG